VRELLLILKGEAKNHRLGYIYALKYATYLNGIKSLAKKNGEGISNIASRHLTLEF
jgi:hypothetical protein